MNDHRKEAVQLLRELADSVETGKVHGIFLATVVENEQGYSYESNTLGSPAGLRALDEGMAHEEALEDMRQQKRAMN